MPATDSRGVIRVTPASQQAAFRELHGPRLHGFALLLTLGDTARAERLASRALADGAARVRRLRHPERAAAWLRAHVVRSARRRMPRRRPDGESRALAQLGADPPVVAGLAALDPIERAAVIASGIERIDARDVATIVGRDGARLERLLARARMRYAAAYAATSPAEPMTDGPLMRRVKVVVHRALA